MASPVLEEEIIKRLLQYPATPDNLPFLQNAAMQCLLDMYDRKLTRPEFIEHGSKAVTLYAQMAKLWLLDHIYELHREGVLTENSFTSAQVQMKELIEVIARELIETVKRMQECPLDEDKIH